MKRHKERERDVEERQQRRTRKESLKRQKKSPTGEKTRMKDKLSRIFTFLLDLYVFHFVIPSPSVMKATLHPTFQLSFVVRRSV